MSSSRRIIIYGGCTTGGYAGDCMGKYVQIVFKVSSAIQLLFIIIIYFFYFFYFFFILIFFLDMHYVDLDFILEEEMELEPILESESSKTENSMKTEITVESKRYSIILLFCK